MKIEFSVVLQTGLAINEELFKRMALDAMKRVDQQITNVYPLLKITITEKEEDENKKNN